jgi:uncharacterized protein YecE (DUF72 family)
LRGFRARGLPRLPVGCQNSVHAADQPTCRQESSFCTPHVPEARADRGLAYIRFHSGSRGRRGNYSESELEEGAERIERWRRDHDVYAYFNNDREGFAVRNALRLKERLGV